MADPWPFADPPDVAVITLRQVFQEGKPVLHVTHDEEDGCWQFLTGEIPEISQGIVVCLQHMIEHDPTLAALADLPLGWQAWRADRDAEWERGPHEG
jgi:hypothetical protein